MKTSFILRPLLVLFILGVTLLSSCKKNDPDPEANRNKFLGTFDLTETCSGSPYEYEIVISAGFDDNEVEIKDFYYPGVNATATVAGNKITIPSQEFTGQYQGEPITVTISGSGTLSGGKLTIDYNATITDLGSDQCTAVAIKQ
ncbi:hypothetical protein [Xanthocytophaga agilis]|uniref:Uncharacterized protein n=1 Tax=Xanthocytophaga agilis TaxID=3048010 RepID=A0AAE3UIL5_9BACT|nr:hypothetical protein [Xanthocytophaga agilis]MDJ1504587.1 hypothetical protein [Xanthocytophaga agilis]